MFRHLSSPLEELLGDIKMVSCIFFSQSRAAPQTSPSLKVLYLFACGTLESVVRSLAEGSFRQAANSVHVAPHSSFDATKMYI